MFKNIVLAAYVAVSFAGACLTSAIPAWADGFEAMEDVDSEGGCGFGWHRNCAGCRCVPN